MATLNATVNASREGSARYAVLRELAKMGRMHTSEAVVSLSETQLNDASVAIVILSDPAEDRRTYIVTVDHQRA